MIKLIRITSGVPVGSGVGIALLHITNLIELVEVNLRHQLGFDMINHLIHRLHEFIEILFVKEDLVPVISIIIESLSALCDGEIIIVAPGCPYIKEISPSFTRPDAFAVNAVHSFFVVVVRHNQ